jgi:soluble lytic murein transglycosylase
MRTNFASSLSLFFFIIIQSSLVVAKLDRTAMDIQNPQVAKVDGAISSLKKHEQNKKWKECSQLAAKEIRKNELIKNWILLTWMKCAQKVDLKAALQVVEFSEKNPILFLEGAARRLLQDEFIKLRLNVLENTYKDKADQAWVQIDQLLKLNIDRDAKAKVLFFAGELSQIQHQLEAAESFFEQSLEQNEVKSVRDKLNALQLALKRTNINKSTNANVEVLPEGEQRFEERFKNSLKNNDLISFVEDAVGYLNQYPNGRRSKWAYDKILDIYQNFNDKSDEEKFANLKKRVLASLEKLESLRAMDIARYLHRRNDFAGSLLLSEEALKSLSQSQMASTLLYIAGRSAQFTGEYKKAKKYFEQYILYHSSADEIGEVQLRLALVHIREGYYSSAIAVLEKLLLSRAAEKYELTARYWLIRSLQQNKNDRAESEIKLLIEKYPFSYYGLKLQLEKKTPLEFPKENLELKKDFFFTKYQKQQLDKAIYLSAQGWVSEALAEFSELTYGDSAETQILLANLLKQNKLYSAAIRLTNAALEQQPSYRNLQLVEIGFPKAYEDLITAQAAKYKLSPILIRALIRQESAFNEKATSVSRAMGLMQLIPPTAQEVATELKIQKIELPNDAYLPEYNIPMGTSYIAKMINQFSGNVPMGLAAYNAGPNRFSLFLKARSEVKDLMNRPSSYYLDEIWFDEIPWMETSLYIKSILRNAFIYSLLENKKLSPPKVQWQDLLLVSGPEKQNAETAK